MLLPVMGLDKLFPVIGLVSAGVLAKDVLTVSCADALAAC
jgi:hypothetical protein